MNLKDIIKAPKSGVDLGKWGEGHIPRANFPMSKLKDKAYKYGPSYSWRCVKFSCLDRKCRVLIILNEDKQIFRARLGIEDGSDMIVLCDYEYHSSEPGWHCHFTPEPVSSIEPGSARSGKRRRPKMENLAASFLVTKANSLTFAAGRYGFEAAGALV